MPMTTGPLRSFLTACVLAVALLLPGAVRADGGGQWNHQPLYAGWRAGTLIGAEVQGLRGDELGEVRDLIVGSDGHAKAVVVEAGGMLGLGQAEFIVPWKDVELGPLPATITIQAVDADVPGLIRNSAALARRPGDWRIGELADRPVHLVDGRAFGRVEDLVFSRGDAALIAVLVMPEHGRNGPYAYPWALARVDHAFGTVRLPTTPGQLQALGRFDVERMQDGIVAGRPP